MRKIALKHGIPLREEFAGAAMGVDVPQEEPSLALPVEPAAPPIEESTYGSDVGMSNILRGAEQINQGFTGVKPDDLFYQNSLKSAADKEAARKQTIKDYMAQKLADRKTQEQRAFQKGMFDLGETGKDRRNKETAEATITAAIGKEERTKRKEIEDAQAQGNIPGWSFDATKTRPKPEAVEKFREQVTEVDKVSVSSKNVVNTLLQKGFANLPDSDRVQLQGDIAHLVTTLNKYYDLGALSGGDQKLLNLSIGNPAEFATYLKTGGNNVKMAEIVNRVIKRARQELVPHGRNLGFTLEQQGSVKPSSIPQNEWDAASDSTKKMLMERFGD